jgi:5-methylthioadenosine/S-adenosylhomocysteine deaminase
MPATLLRGGCVLSLGHRTPNLTGGDVVIEDGLIAEVGTGLRSRDAEVVDATDTIVMPGFVDAHRHLWTSLFRNLGGPASGSGDLHQHLAPDDVYAATLIGLLGAAEAGVTTVVDWSPYGDPDSCEASLQAHADAGLRTVLALGGTVGPSLGELRDRCVAVAGPRTLVAAGSGPAGEDARARWDAARALGLRVHAHGGPGQSRGAIAAAPLAEDVTLIHLPALDDEDVSAIASSGAAVAMTPAAEMARGEGSPPVQALVDRDVRPGLGVDDEKVTPGDLFAQMRAMISLQHAMVFDRKLAGKAGVPKLMSTRDVIRSATVDGARAAGLAGLTGSLVPGAQADVVVLRTDRPNIFPINDPIGAVVWGMDTSNVDHVFVGGHGLVRDGALTGDVARARDLATEARGRVAAAAGLAVGGAA